jgi:hypothetical protein
MTRLRTMMLGTLSAAVLAIGCTAIALAATLPQPVEHGILTVTGKISSTNSGGGALFDLPMLEKLGVSRLETSTAWTEGTPVFEGVLVSDLLKALGAKGDTITAVALNDYKVEIPISDFTAFPVILAYKMNGEILKIRDKGPLWFIYPQDQYPELKTKQTQNKWVWQIKEIQIH